VQKAAEDQELAAESSADAAESLFLEPREAGQERKLKTKIE
jgi:hypothetical protein